MRLTWATLVASALGVAFTSACYALSPVALALPVPSARLAEALAAAGHGAPLLGLGGNVGVLSDVLFAAAALVLAMHARGPAVLGWSLGAVSATVFTLVDAMASRSLVAGPSFALAKPLFDVLFTGGTWAFAIATLLVFWPERRRVLGKLGLGVGAAGVVASAAVLFGADLPQAMGLVIASGVLVYALEGLSHLLAGPAQEQNGLAQRA
jgi:hypothetical protein